MRNNRYFLTLSLGLIVFLSACNNEVKLPYEFKSQPIQGLIDNQDWLFVEGVARSSIFNEDTLFIQLFNESRPTPCDYLISESGARFTVPAQPGLYLLSSIAQSYQVISLYRGEAEYPALSGAIEILQIDSVEGIVSGQIDARYDGSNYLNGSFSVPLCN